MTAGDDPLPGLVTRRIETRAGHIVASTGGRGPPLLLLHGYPETRLAWRHLTAPLAELFTVVAADLRGYGDSAKPASNAAHAPYAKRAMAAEMVEVMQSLGHRRFAVAGHDRGGRVGYRLALDHPDRIDQLVLIDILTTLDQWQVMAPPHNRPMQHWPLLAQPAPLPEALISAAPKGWIEGCLKRGARGGSLAPFVGTALEAYARALTDTDCVHATCEDFRAGATLDIDDDRADRTAGRAIDCPVLLAVASHGSLAGGPDAASLWKQWCRHSTTVAIVSGHFVPEEAPAALLEAMLQFLIGGGGGP